MKNIYKAGIILSLIALLSMVALPITAQVLDNPLGNLDPQPQDLYGRLIFAFMGITGIIALLMFIIGGFQWMTAGGNAEKVKKGRDTLMWAVFGLIVIFSSYAILREIFNVLNS